MKILISESQYNLIIESVPLKDSTIKRRLKRAKEIAVNYPNPRQFALKYKKLWNFLRLKGLIDDVFPSRKKYQQDLTSDRVKELASKYVAVSDFQIDYPVEYGYAIKHNMIKDLFPNSDFDRSSQMIYHASKDQSPYYNKNIQKHLDHLIYRASSQYKDMNDLKKRNPDLYRQLSDLGHDYIPSDDDIHY